MPKQLEKQRQELAGNIVFSGRRRYSGVLQFRIPGCGFKDKIYVHLAGAIAYCVENHLYLDWDGDIAPYGNWIDWFLPFAEPLNLSGLPHTVYSPSWNDPCPLLIRILNRYPPTFVRNIWKLNDDTQRRIEDEKRRLLSGCPYAAVQVRRGDKLRWGQIQYVSAKTIISHIPADIRVLFVATDDFTVVEELQKLAGEIEVITTCEQRHRGSDAAGNHFHGTGAAGCAETLRLLADLEICRSADSFLRVLPQKKLGLTGFGRNLQIADLISDLRCRHREICIR